MRKADNHIPAAGTGWPGHVEFHLTDEEFEKFSRLIYNTAGIKLAPVKKTMLSARLQKRVKFLGLANYQEYLQHLLTTEGQQNEMVFMLDAVSTNKTEFFREPAHFRLLTDRILPAIIEHHPAGRPLHLRAWSAGCSSGEEPFTLAMVLEEFCSHFSWLSYSILATDLCTSVLANAQRAVYEDQKIGSIPKIYRNKYLMRGVGKRQGLHRVVPELRQKVTFRRLNFMAGEFGLKQPIDILFCRNVLIYFDSRTRATLFKKFYRHLAPQGYLFIGHSESLEGINDQMLRISSTLFMKKPAPTREASPLDDNKGREKTAGDDARAGCQ